MKIAFIGAGNMAGAIVNAMLSGGRALASDITVFDKDTAKYASFKVKGVNCAESLDLAVNGAAYILIAVKPQDCEKVLSDIRQLCVDIDKKIFISICAGISTDFICKCLGKPCPVVRVMPNTPLMVGCGATAVCKNSLVPGKEFTKICGIFASSGVVSVVDESVMNEVVSVNGSGPAYVFLFAKAMIDSAIGQGIDEKVAKSLTVATIAGAAKMMQTSEFSVDELIAMVKSPRGTTEKALDYFESNDFCDIIDKAMIACTDRAKELGK